MKSLVKPNCDEQNYSSIEAFSETSCEERYVGGEFSRCRRRYVAEEEDIDIMF